MSDQDNISWIETHQHPDDKVTIVERWIPADKGDYAPLFCRDKVTGEIRSFKLESRRVLIEG